MEQGDVVRVVVALLIAAALIVAVVLYRRREARPPLADPGDGTQPARAAGAPLAVVDVVPDKLQVCIFSHVISAQEGPVPCWTYVSDGLAAEGQQEIALSVKREGDEAEGAYPTAPLDLYRSIHAFAVKKQLVSEGDSTQLNRSHDGLLRRDLHGVLYTAGQPLAGVSVSGPFLTALLVTGPEIDAATQFGHVRLMAILGEKYRFFPTAPWLDRRRAEVTRPEAMASSMLAKVARRRLKGARVRHDAPADAPGTMGTPGATVRLTLRRDAGKRLAAEFAEVDPANAALGLLVDLDPEADATLVWGPPGEPPQAISAPGATGARMAGDFLMLAAGVDRDGARAVEDGYALLLTKESWEKLRAAVAAGQPMEVPGSGDLTTFALSWVEESYWNPIDGKTYTPEGGWRTHHPTTPAAVAPGAVVKSTGIRLLIPESELAARVETDALASYVKVVDEVVSATVGDEAGGPGFDVLLELELTPGGAAKAKVAGRPAEAAPPVLHQLGPRVEAVEAPPIHGGPVRLQVMYAVRGGYREP